MRLSSRQAEVTFGASVLAMLAMNVGWHIAHGRWFDVFWLCNAAAFLAGLALLGRSALLATISFVWLVPGTLCWGVEAGVLGSAFGWPSYFLHLGGAMTATYAVWRLGAHRAGYIGALVLLALVLGISRVLPAGANVNCAFGPRAGWRVFQFLPFGYWFSVALFGALSSFLMNQVALYVASAPTYPRSPAPDPRPAPERSS